MVNLYQMTFLWRKARSAVRQMERIRPGTRPTATERLKTEYSEALTALEPMREELKELLEEIKEPDEHAFMFLLFVKGYTVEQIMKSLGKSHSLIYLRLASAKKNLLTLFPDRFTLGYPKAKLDD